MIDSNGSISTPNAPVVTSSALTPIARVRTHDSIDASTAITSAHVGAMVAGSTASTLGARVGAADARPSAAIPIASPRASRASTSLGQVSALRPIDASTVTASAHVGATRPTVSDASPRIHNNMDETADAVSGGNSVVRGSVRLETAILYTQAKAALTALGWKPAIAAAAIAAAASAPGVELTLERLIFEALRRCPTPKT
jgi:hypothetical protein